MVIRFLKMKKKKLKTLNKFMDKYAYPNFNNLHILPFFPYSSDDGFSIKDYEKVRHDLGDWSDVQSLSKKYQLMSDIVINHASKKVNILKSLLRAMKSSKDYFITLNDTNGYESVIRPRSSDLFQEVEINQESLKLWCTFSHDQIDLNFKNPKVLFFLLN